MNIWSVLTYSFKLWATHPSQNLSCFTPWHASCQRQSLSITSRYSARTCAVVFPSTVRTFYLTAQIENFFLRSRSKTIYHLGAGQTPRCQEQIGEAKSYMHWWCIRLQECRKYWFWGPAAAAAGLWGKLIYRFDSVLHVLVRLYASW